MSFSRNEIETFAQENQIAWREDSSNSSNKYLRNKLRHDVIPILKELNSSLLSSFENTIKNLKQSQSLVDDASKMIYEKVAFEEERIVSVKERYQKSLKEFENVDETRFYQEMAYFTEKLDISEEKVRLTQHLKYYKEVMDNESFNGKKLGFISQEIGREINTIGSKANDAEIQKHVIRMKDELEKIKEQSLNVL